MNAILQLTLNHRCSSNDVFLPMSFSLVYSFHYLDKGARMKNFEKVRNNPFEYVVQNCFPRSKP